MTRLDALLKELEESGDTTSLNLADHIRSWLETDWGEEKIDRTDVAINALKAVRDSAVAALKQLEGRRP